MEAANQICRHFKFGYCRFGINCHYRHNKVKCVDETCDSFSCDKRHPKECKYWKWFGMCKFGSYCQYKHSRNKCEIMEEEIKALKEQIKNLENVVTGLSKILQSLKQHVEIKNDLNESSLEVDDSGVNGCLETSELFDHYGDLFVGDCYLCDEDLDSLDDMSEFEYFEEGRKVCQECLGDFIDRFGKEKTLCCLGLPSSSILPI